MSVLDRPELLCDRLADWVNARLGNPGSLPVRAELLGPPPTGNSNVTLPFAVTWDGDGEAPVELVLRLQHPANQIFLDADVHREFRVLSGLGAAGGVPSPTPRWFEPDPEILGHPFFVMDRVEGVVPVGKPSIHASGWLAERTPGERKRAWASSLAALAAVHGVDWRRHAGFLADAAHGTTIATRLAHARRWYDWVTDGRTYPITDAALDHLERTAHRIDDTNPVLLWGDARLGNTMFGADGTVAALLDWELASVGPAALDVGWWLCFDEFVTTAHGIERLDGYPTRAETIAEYAALTDSDLDELHWFEIYCAWVLTVTVIRMADIGVTEGRLAPETRMGEGNLTAQMLARWLDLPVPDLDPDYAARRGLPVR